MTKNPNLFLIAFCLAFVLPDTANSQTLKLPPTNPVSTMEMTVGKESFGSYFEPPPMGPKSGGKVSVFVETKRSNWFLSGNGQFTRGLFDKNGFSLKAKNEFFSKRLLKVDVGLSYSYSKTKERFFGIDRLRLIGSTNKNSVLASMGIGHGVYDQNNFRFSLLIGYARMKHILDIYVDNQLSNLDNNDFGKDSRIVIGEEISTSLKPSKNLVIEVTGRHFKAPVNKQKIIPSDYLVAEGRVIFSVYKNLGISVRGTYVSNPYNLEFASRSAEIGVAIRIKPAH
jgi:hypothetical protein